MASTGQILPDILYPASSNRNNLYSKTRTVNSIGESYFVTSLEIGSVSENLPLDIHSSAVTGHAIGAYVALFYSHIRIEPLLVEDLSVSSDIVRVITVFNGYFIDRTLENITEQDTTGITLVGDSTPDTYYPLEEKTYILTVTADGPTTIDAYYHFDFDGSTDDLTLQINGVRMIIFPYLYKPGLKENLQWYTKVLSSFNGSEQRYKARGNPRQFFKLTAYANKDERNRVGNLLYGNRVSAWGVPVWSEQRLLSSAVTIDDTILHVDTLYGDFRIGSRAVIWANHRDYHVLNITGLTDTTITAAIGIPSNYTLGSIVAPIRTGVLIQNPIRKTTGFYADVIAKFEISDNTNLDPGPSDIQYLDLDVMLDEPLRPSKYLTDIYSTRVDVLDYKTGLVELNAPYIYHKPSRKIQYIFESLEEIWNFRLWLHRRSGRLVPFWMPSFENDLILISTGSLTNLLEVQNNEYIQTSTARDHIAVFVSSGTVLLRAIVSAELNENAEITLDSSLGIDASEVEFISYLGLKRLNSDNISIEWLANNVATVELPIVELEP